MIPLTKIFFILSLAKGLYKETKDVFDIYVKAKEDGVISEEEKNAMIKEAVDIVPSVINGIFEAKKIHII